MIHCNLITCQLVIENCLLDIDPAAFTGKITSS